MQCENPAIGRIEHKLWCTVPPPEFFGDLGQKRKYVIPDFRIL